MMQSRFLMMALMISALSACSSETNETQNTNTASVAAAVQEPQPSDAYQHYAWLNRQTEAKLQHANAEQANQIYENYRNETDAILQELNNREADLLDNYADDSHWLSDTTASQPQPNPELAQKQQQLAAVGLRYVEIGAGTAEIAPLPQTEPKLFANKVSADYRDFIVQQDHENTQLADIDNAIVISWDELGKRVVFWEQFVQRYPQSPLKAEAEQHLAWYTDAFLFGLDSTPTEDGSQLPEGEAQEEAKRFFDEMSHAWLVFERQYPQSPVSAQIQQARIIAQLPEDLRWAEMVKWRAQNRRTANATKPASATP